MGLLHVSINAKEPVRVAGFLAHIMGGRAMPFPPFPDCWIAFARADDGTAIEVYPLTHELHAGPRQIDCRVADPKRGPSFVHAAICTPLSAQEVIDLAAAEGWLARVCNRGPFECVEVWLEDRLLVEVLDPDMQRNYRRGMTMRNWQVMFGLD